MKIAVVGGGSWGTALADLLARKGDAAVPPVAVSLWAWEKEVVDAIGLRHENVVYLPGIPLPARLSADGEIEAVLSGAKWVLFAVPSHAAREVLTRMRPFLREDTPIISATKGIEGKSLLFTSEVMREALGRSTTDQIAVLSGPSFAQEVARSHPTAVTLSASNLRLSARAQKVFSTPTFRLFLNSDMIGVQAGGALKNVMALAAGISDGLGFGYNTKAILMAQGLSEMARLGVAMGAERSTFFGLSGMGDLFLTCSGALSRNREVGQKLGEGMSLAKIQAGMKSVAEGVYTTESAYALSKRYRIQTPIIRETYRILFEEKPPKQAMLDLLKLARGREL